MFHKKKGIEAVVAKDLENKEKFIEGLKVEVDKIMNECETNALREKTIDDLVGTEI